ncbi:MFS polyamine transporter [Cristinia sonorae]|uniref:MFS polyamine transporter n=1 Tax=Cristinia sonorae TaxID=1940300 RepID=A0A8K0UD75_9AGAR|nr:MFS polyamine transporter [Cristinia sonorae]
MSGLSSTTGFGVPDCAADRDAGSTEDTVNDLEKITSGATASAENAEQTEELEETKERLSLKGETEDIVFVDWDGANDPENPRNWSNPRKWLVTITVALYTGISPLVSSVGSPAGELVKADLNISSPVVVNLTTTVFVLAFAFGPMVFGPLSEVFGRRRVLHLANIFFLIFNLACGFAQNTSQLIVFRFLAGLGGSCPFSVGGGVVGDVWRPDERGQAVAIFSLSPFLGPAIGPIAGAWIAQTTTWRWAFWSTAIATAVLQIAGFIVLKESYAPIILERKARARRQLLLSQGIQTSQVRVVGVVKQRWRVLISRALVRPFALFYRETIIQVFGIYMAFIYGLLYLFLTSMPGIFKGVYGESIGISGLHYIALGLGITIGSIVNSLLMDKVYLLFRKRNGGESRPEFRLPLMVPGSILLPIGLLLTGWTARSNIHWIVPDLGIFFVGAGIILDFVAIQTYVIDAFTLHAASALAAVLFFRAMAGFGFPLFSPYMYSALGYGNGDTILACFAIIVGIPAPFFFWHFGERFRRRSKYTHAQK